MDSFCVRLFSFSSVQLLLLWSSFSSAWYTFSPAL
jgi:hypothetical protein